MNLYGLLTVLEKYQIPSFHLRIVSDQANDQAAADFKSFLAHYNGDGGTRLAHIVQRLPPDKSDVENYPSLRKLLVP